MTIQGSRSQIRKKEESPVLLKKRLDDLEEAIKKIQEQLNAFERNFASSGFPPKDSSFFP